jgi:hypothetical protein
MKRGFVIHHNGPPARLDGRPHARTIDANGYVRLRIGGENVYEHRWVWEQAHDPIPPGHHVHHVNHDRADNRLENLRLIEGKAHVSRHNVERHRDGSLNNRGCNSGRWRRDLLDAEIVRRHDAGESFRAIGRSLGAAHNVVAHHYRLANERRAS